MSAKDLTSLEGDDRLAAEFALGVLDVQAHAEAAQRFERDAAFRALARGWMERLAPMGEDIAPVAPPAPVKARLEARLFGAAKPEAAGGAVWIQSLMFWRGATAFASVAAVVLAGVLMAPADTPSAPANETRTAGYFAALRAGDATPVVLVRYDPEAQALFISGPVSGPEAAPTQPELWVIPPGEGAAPRSLGLIASLSGDLTERVAVDDALAVQIADGAVLAISLEPAGGSPTGAPTGPVIALGAVQSL